MDNNLSPILRILSGELRISIDTPRDDDVVIVGPQETAVASSLLAVVSKYGKFNEDGDGVWAGYESPSENDVQHIGVKCANCIMWEGGSSCKLISLPVEAGGKCRFAVIPNGVVRKSAPKNDYLSMDLSIHTVRAFEFIEKACVDQELKSMKYTKPELRENIKRRIMAGSKGGRPGQWSARKAQLVAQEYRRAGGGYRGKPGGAQRSLKKWTRERWTTADGKPALRKGRMTRYLPAKAWKKLSPAQRRATIAKKLAGDKRGRQFVSNTERARKIGAGVRNSRKSLNAHWTTNFLGQTFPIRKLFIRRKQLGAQIGGTIGSLISKAREKGQFGKCRGLTMVDGDGDGFVCNPVTGNDDLPMVGSNPVLQSFWGNIIKDSAIWAEKYEKESVPNIKFDTPSGHAQQMLKNMANRGFIIEKTKTGVKVQAPPQFRKRYLAIRAIGGDTSFDNRVDDISVGYHIYHSGNDPHGPETAFAKAMLKLFAYDPLNDNLYSPYGEYPNTYDSLIDPKKDVKKFARSIIPEWEDVEGGIPYVSDKPGTRPRKDKNAKDKYYKDLEYARLREEADIFLKVLGEIQERGLYEGQDTRRVPEDTVGDDWVAIDELSTMYGDAEIAELLNYDPDIIREYLTRQDIPIRDNEVLDFIRKDEEEKRKRPAKPFAPYQPPIGFRQGESAKPPILNLADKGVDEPISYDDYVDVLPWMVFQDNQLRQKVRPEILQNELNANPRLARIVRAISPIRYEQQIMGTDEIPGGSNSDKIQDMNRVRQYMKEYFTRIVSERLQGGGREFASRLGLSHGMLEYLIFFLTRKESTENLEALLRNNNISNHNLLTLYKQLHWLGLLPLLKDMPNYEDLMPAETSE